MTATRTPAGTAPSTLVARLRDALDRDDPVPLYHQVASVLRWEIGLGRAAVGEPLPPIRWLSEAIGVNYHTVRRAYTALAEEGVAEPMRGVGTVVRGRPTRVAWRPVGAPGTGPAPGPGAAGPGCAAGGRVVVVECNMTQAAALARQVACASGVVTVPWLLEGYGEPPAGLLLGTTFHELEMRRLWPQREAGIRALRLELDPEAGDVVRRIAASLGVRRVVMVERDVGTAESISAELREALAGAPLAVERIASPALRPADVPDALVVYAPRVWDGLAWRERSDPRAMTLRMPFPAGELA
ncbi:MAG: GntR family transcriptional regulator, partial [Gemmatimonadota bacterium]